MATIQIVCGSCTAWYGAIVCFMEQRLSPGWQAVGFMLMVAGGTLLLHFFTTEKPPANDEWLTGKGKDGTICLTRRRRKP